MSNTYILKYTLEELNETETSIESILEDVLSTVDNVNILFEYSPEQIRLLHKKYGDSAFLDPKTKKYPIVDMKGNKNQQLLYAAYIDLKRKSGITGTNDLAQKGIVYNLEQRSLIATVGNKLVSTFEVTNENLLRLIRLQQSDMTYSQLGAEARLTQLLNGVFQDSSYLTDMYDTVSAALIDASSTMTRDQATSFNYAVQKWLGALYSVGMSESAISAIAEGFNLLATGNASALTSNSQLNTLFAMSAARAGRSYSELLTSGLNGENVDELMTAMVSYLQDIANNTSNQVTKQAYGSIFNMSMSDLRAVTNLLESDIATINANDITYASAMNEYNLQTQALTRERTSIADYWNNISDNLIYDFGLKIAQDSSAYSNWKLQEILTGLGSMVDTSLGGTGVISTLANFIGNLFSAPSTLGSLVDVVSAFFNSETGSPSFRDMDNNEQMWFGFLSGVDGWDYTQRGGRYSGTTGVTGGSTNLFDSFFGSIAQGVSDIVRGLSSSTDFSIGNTTAEKSALSFAQQANAITYSSTTVQNAEQATVVRTVGDVYAQLFENKAVIRVSVSDLESMASESMTRAINNSIDNGEEDSLAQTTRDIKKTLDEKMVDKELFGKQMSSAISAIKSAM